MPPNFCTFGLTWSARCEFFGAFSPVPEAERSEEHTSELQSRLHLVCRLLLEKKKIDRPVNELKTRVWRDGDASGDCWWLFTVAVNLGVDSSFHSFHCYDVLTSPVVGDGATRC